MASFVSTLLLLVAASQVNCQQDTSPYEPHETYPPVTITPVTVTVFVTDTITHTLRETTTSDVWITDQTTVTQTLTATTTDWSFVSYRPSTRTSVIKITSTPVEVVTATSYVYPLRTMVSEYTSFFTTTSVVELWQSITHVSVIHQVHTVPVVSTQELVQEIVTTLTEFITVTVTSASRYGHN
ncbi:uncharacterized protein LOC121857451 [Homarus americanus]|uniref:uncharacterized protein LOC121857451 n=1 Tax=Homarus americanus TaxID=6706 RepID=UPI001C485BA4|nr:uncharacterized protein LOC121857451 [Homarus americanus]